MQNSSWKTKTTLMLEPSFKNKTAKLFWVTKALEKFHNNKVNYTLSFQLIVFL